MLTFDEARARILGDAPRVASERVDLRDAVGRVLAEDLVATEPRPAFDYSAMDGYVLALDDVPAGDGPFELRVLGESRTGGAPVARVEPGTACRIFTGAMVPPRGDAVVMQEDVVRAGDVATFARRPRGGEYIRRAGDDLARGAVALAAGTRMRATHVVLVAALDRARVTVARRPVVSIVATGDELREPGERDRPGAVVDSIGPTLAAMVRACGGAPRVLPFAPDALDATRAAIEHALDGADLVITVGGVSVGAHDTVKPALEAAGVALDFWRVAIKPGKPLVVGRAGAKRFLGLPGNPTSALLTFALFGAPLVRAMQGDRAPLAPTPAATLTRELRHATGRLEFVRATLSLDADGDVLATPLVGQASGSVTSMAWADALVVFPADLERVAAGARVRVIPLGDV